jgi:hypothetical protein
MRDTIAAESRSYRPAFIISDEWRLFGGTHSVASEKYMQKCRGDRPVAPTFL